MATLPGIRRQLKNVACNYSDAQVKVREATSNDPWGPSSTLMSEIADMTQDSMAFTEIMQLVWKRLNDHGKNWRHVYKSLVLLDYLVKTGSDKVAQQCRENIYAISTLKDFQHIEEGKDQGMNVREKAKALTNLLRDDERLRNERQRAIMAKRRFAQNGMGISSDGATHSGARRHLSSGGASEAMDEARPGTQNEEELQLQIALALSKEEADKEEEARRGDAARLEMALEESKRNGSIPGPSGTGSAIDDLLSIESSLVPQTQPAVQSPVADPWSPVTSQPNSGRGGDPWAAAATIPPPSAQIGSAKNDPWAPVNGTTMANNADPFGDSGLGSNTDREISDALSPLSLSNGFSMQQQPMPTAVAPTAMLSFDDVNKNIQPAVNADPWAQPMMPMLAPTGGSNTITDSAKARGTKTPETFLGENSNLVNLDNLVGGGGAGVTAAAKPAAGGGSIFGAVPTPLVAAGIPADAAMANKGAAPTTNPFLSTHAAPTNPFAANRPSPTLNQMRSQSAAGQPILQPSNAAAGSAQQDNPFV